MGVWSGADKYKTGKADVVLTIKEVNISYDKRNIYCLVTNNGGFYASTTKYDIDKCLSLDEENCFTPGDERILAFHGFVLDVKKLPSEIKPELMKNRSILLFRQYTHQTFKGVGQGPLLPSKPRIEIRKFDTLKEAMLKIEMDIAGSQANIDEYMVLFGSTCELSLCIRAAVNETLLEREVYS